MSKTYCTQLRLSREQEQALRAYADDYGWNLSQAIREALRVTIQRHQEEKELRAACRVKQLERLTT
jgi:hypothetical protein